MKSNKQGLNIFLAIVLTGLIVGFTMHSIYNPASTSSDTVVENTQTQSSDNNKQNNQTQTSDNNKQNNQTSEAVTTAETPVQADLVELTSETDKYKDLLADAPVYVVNAVNLGSLTDKDLVYISGHDSKSALLYEYNTSTQSIETVAFTEDADHQWRIIGLQGEELIMMLEPIDYSPNQCFEMFAFNGTFQSYNLSTQEISDYTPSETVVTQAKEKAEKCQESLS